MNRNLLAEAGAIAICMTMKLNVKHKIQFGLSILYPTLYFLELTMFDNLVHRIYNSSFFMVCNLVVMAAKQFTVYIYI